MPHPQPSVLNIQGVQSEGQVEGVVEEPVEVGAPGAAEFQGPRIFMHAPQYEWHPEVHIQGQDEEARQRIVLIEELLHRFGCRAKVREEELRLRLDEEQASYATFTKECTI